MSKVRIEAVEGGLETEPTIDGQVIHLNLINKYKCALEEHVIDAEEDENEQQQYTGDTGDAEGPLPSLRSLHLLQEHESVLEHMSLILHIVQRGQVGHAGTTTTTTTTCHRTAMMTVVIVVMTMVVI